jgi:hypothetical protein
MGKFVHLAVVKSIKIDGTANTVRNKTVIKFNSD